MKPISLFIAVFIFTICGLANAQTVSPEQLKNSKTACPLAPCHWTRSYYINLLNKAKKSPLPKVFH